MALSDIETQIEQLSQDSKLRVFRQLALDLTHAWPGIEKTPEVQGGDACIVRTRLPVWTLQAYRELGWGDQNILDNFPTLRPVDLFYAWLYVEGNQEEIQQAILEQQEA